MTHDELLAKINNLPEVIGLAEFKVRHDALRAVVELHQDYGGICPDCSFIEYPTSYPCQTIKTITEVLT